jgi:DNA-binding NarL/FixJ family response regulator
VSEPLQVVVGEDDVLLREGIARLLAEAGFDVVAQAPTMTSVPSGS